MEDYPPSTPSTEPRMYLAQQIDSRRFLPDAINVCTVQYFLLNFHLKTLASLLAEKTSANEPSTCATCCCRVVVGYVATDECLNLW